MAAGALYALEHHRGRLAEDHRRARLLAEGLAAMSGIELDLEGVETNIVRFCSTVVPAPELVDRARRRGLAVLAFNRMDLRAIPHLDVSDDDVTTALEILHASLGA